MAAISKHIEAEKSLEYLRTGRGMPWVKLGMRVDVNGRPAKIIGGTDNLVICYDGTKSKTYAHPFWQTAYYDEDGKLIAVNGKLIAESPVARHCSSCEGSPCICFGRVDGGAS